MKSDFLRNHFCPSSTMEPRQPFIVRLPPEKHWALKSYCRRYRYPMQVVVENLIDQLLVQVCPGYDEPDDEDRDGNQDEDGHHDAP